MADLEFYKAFFGWVLATWVCSVCASFLDMWTGIDKARAKKERISSRGLRRTIEKIGDYWRVQAFALMFDVFGSLYYSHPLASFLIGAGVCLIEFRSVVENLKEKRSNAGGIVGAVKDVVNIVKEAKNGAETNS